ncbi:transposase [Paenibacillus selenitireducens]|uniref:transposase n=1 Tax=Paenibacillus selenitireducens TaxID=1324314 RepID=UPI001E496034|nr:transposase [Paenibacillus selenitireducens]
MGQHVLKLALEEGFIPDDTIAIDATHFEARDQAPAKQGKIKEAPKKRGRKAKHEREAWLLQQQLEEEQKSIFDKKIADLLPESYEKLRQQMPIAPEWGIKCNSEGKNFYWYRYKGHLAVGTQSQYILGALLSSGNMNDGKAAIALLKGIKAQFLQYAFNYATMDAGYDYEPIYEEIRKTKADAIIAYNPKA